MDRGVLCIDWVLSRRNLLLSDYWALGTQYVLPLCGHCEPCTWNEVHELDAYFVCSGFWNGFRRVRQGLLEYVLPYADANSS